MRKMFAVPALSVLIIALSGCGAELFSVPDVTGYQLDNAHNILKDAGFKNFEDVDAIEDREPMMDMNWVVLEQSPSSDERVEKNTKIQLDIAKPGDPGVRDRLPVGSPVHDEMRKRDEANAAYEEKADRERQDRQREQEAKDKKEVKSFVETIDPGARIAQNALADLAVLAENISMRGSVTRSESSSLLDIKNALGVYWEALEDAPHAANNSADKIQESIRSFQKSSDTLRGAEGYAATGSIERFNQIYEPAKREYNSGLSEMYGNTGISAPEI